MAPDAQPARPWPLILVATLGGLLYSGGAELGHWFLLPPQHAAIFWPAHGLYLALLLTYPPSQWPMLVGAALFLGHVCPAVLWHGQSLVASGAYGIGNSLEVMLGASLLRRYGRQPFGLQTVADVLVLLVFGALLSPILGATLGVATAGLVDAVPFWATWPLRWLGDVTGILIAAPLALLVGTWSREGVRWPRPAHLAEGAGMLVATAAVAYVLGTQHAPCAYLVFPLVLWAGLRGGMPGVIGVITVLALSVARATAIGQGLFADPRFSQATQILLAQTFLGVQALSGLLLGTIVTQWRHTQQALQAANDTLEAQGMHRTAALRRSEALHRLALDAAQLGTWQHDLTTDRLEFDATARAHHGLAGEVSLAAVVACAHPEDRPQLQQVIATALDPAISDGRSVTTYRIVHPDGAVRWLEIHARVTFTGTGAARRPLLAVGTSQDITDRRTGIDALIRAEHAWQTLNADLEQRVIERTQDLRQEIAERRRLEDHLRTVVAEKDLLLREIHHRVKNNMQVISSILQLQSTAMDTPQLQSVIHECRNRVRTMALIHEQLYSAPTLTSIDSQRYLHELVDMLGRFYTQPRVRWQVEVEALPLDIETAIPLGLIVHELIANACKHAFPERRCGTLTVRLHRVSSDTACLTVQDDGIGLPDGQLAGTTQSLGFRMVQALVHQLDATMTSRSGDGTTIDLVLPLPVLASEERSPACPPPLVF